ncbi:bidirectional sugar transporter SWEET5-like [Henckelia pumila]|uniref:bidirectional sugar transporter SWEET5-like n=1 Tax=Henckelia pumila TaxID=405737 RepID=UPI003C6E2AFD
MATSSALYGLNALTFDYESLYKMNKQGITEICKALELSGLRSFLDLKALEYYQKDLLSLYHKSKIKENGQLILSVGGHHEEISEGFFAETFNLPTSGTIDFSAISTTDITEMKHSFSGSNQPISLSGFKRDLKLEYQLLADIVAKSILSKGGSFAKLTVKKFRSLVNFVEEMTHPGQALARTIVGIVGNVISFGLFISPAATFKRIWQKKSTEEFHPYPYLLCVLNCAFWVFYGLPVVHPDSTLVVTINGIGLALELIYLAIFSAYTSKKNRKIIVGFLLGEAALVGIIATITLLCFHTHTKRSTFVGAICVVAGILMYGSPLSILKKVIDTKSVEFLPFWLCLAGFVNGLVWFTYANLKSFDLFIAIGNGVGALLGLVQLSVYFYYKLFGKPAVQDDVKPTGEVQLQTSDVASLPV